MSQNKCLTLQPQQKTVFMKIRKRGVILLLLFLACMLTGRGSLCLQDLLKERITEEKLFNHQRKEYIQESENLPLDKTILHLYNSQIAYPPSVSCFFPADNTLGKLLYHIPREATLSLRSSLYILQHSGYIWSHPLSGRSTDYIYRLKRLLI